MTSLDTLSNKSLGLFAFEYMGQALAALNAVGDQTQVELLECLNRGGTTDLLFLGSLPHLRELSEIFQKLGSQTSVYIEKPNVSLLKALLNLENSDVQAGLLVFESDSLGRALEVAQALLASGWFMVDFKIPRSAQSRIVLTMTAAAATIEEYHIPESNSLERYTLISKASGPLRSFFDLKPIA